LRFLLDEKVLPLLTFWLMLFSNWLRGYGSKC